MNEQPILHEAFEQGEARPFTKDEAGAWVWAAAILGVLWGVPLGVLVGGGIALFNNYNLVVYIIIGAGAGYLLVSGAVILRGMWPQFRRLWEEREVTAYAPPQPEPPQLEASWRSPIPVHGREGTTLLDMNERPMLPDPEAARQITPPVVAEILKASIEQYDGKWSRRKLMALRIMGQKVSRGMYEELTSALHQCGILQQTRQGGFELPHDIKRFEDLADYLPSLPGLGGMGGGTGRDGNGGDIQDSRLTDGAGRVNNLAERRRQRYLECDCNINDYLKQKGGE